jgi:hypothetical protein
MGMLTEQDKQELMAFMREAIEHHAQNCPNTSGVNNFRNFQRDVSAKMNFVHGAAWAWTFILTAMIGIAIWAFGQAYKPFRAIMAEYYHNHPEARVKPEPKSLMNPYAERYVVHLNPQQQDATVPAGVENTFANGRTN